MAVRSPTGPARWEDDGDRNALTVYEQDNPGERKVEFRNAAASVVSKLATMANDAVTKRLPIENRWLQDERQYHGRYDELTEKNLRNATTSKSRAILNLTAPKTNAWSARLGDLLFPADDRNWGIKETPVPELAQEADRLKAEADAADDQAAQTSDSAMAAQDRGEPMDPRVPGQVEDLLNKRDDLQAEEAKHRKILEIAKKRATAMMAQMDDQLTESLFPKRCRDVLDDACRLGTGIIKGPLFCNRPRRKWGQMTDEGGQPTNVYQLQQPTDDRPEYVRVDPWSFFPDPNARNLEEAEFTFERHLPNKSQLRKMCKRLGFDEEATRELLSQGPGLGLGSDINYLTQLRDISNEGQAVQGRYVVWEYHGVLEKEDVITLLHGMDRSDDAERFSTEHDDLDEIRCIIYFCDGMLLKVSEEYVLDSGESLYSAFNFLKSDASILGALGVPSLMRDPAAALNAVWRMMLDNAALSVGPQIVVDKTRIEPENGDWKLVSRKVWKKTGQDAGPNDKAFEIFNVPNNQNELAGIVELALKFVDELTSLPLIAQGEQGQHVTQTANGMSMLMNSANVIFRRVVKNWDDDLTTPCIRRLFDWNMQFNPREDIKGDMQIEARGTSVLLVREIQSQNLMAITMQWSSHPVLGPALKAYDAMRMTLQSLSINPDDVLVSADEYIAKLKQISEAASQDDGGSAQAQASIQVAQIRAQSASDVAGINLQIAQKRLEAEKVKLDVDGHATAAKLNVQEQAQQTDIAHQERTQAVDIAVEAQRAKEAKAAGDDPAAAVGKGIG